MVRLLARVKSISGGEGFAVDASLIVADANKQRSIAGEDWDHRAAIPETASTGRRRSIWRPSMTRPSVRRAT